jgi:hypothetical protein
LCVFAAKLKHHHYLQNSLFLNKEAGVKFEDACVGIDLSLTVSTDAVGEYWFRLVKNGNELFDTSS